MIDVGHSAVTQGNERTIVKGDPLPQKGEDYFLFLETFEKSPAAILGGPVGRFVEKNGQFRSVSRSEGFTISREELTALKATAGEATDNPLTQ